MEQKITFTLTVAEVNLILSGLGKLPLESGLDLFSKLKAEGERQLVPVETQEQAPKAEAA